MNTVAVGPIGSAGHESVAGPVIIERDGESFQRNEKDSAFLPSSPPSCSCLPLSPLEVSAPLSRTAYTGQVRVGGEGGSDKNQNEAALPG